MRRSFAEYADPALHAVCQAITEDPQLLALAGHACVGSFMPYFFLSCVRYLFLKDPSHPLAAQVIEPATAGELTPAQYRGFREYCLAHAPTLKKLLASQRTQTNDVLRSAVLFPAFCLASLRSEGRSLGLVEVGASAGLNLCWDLYAYDYGERGRFGAVDSPVQLQLQWRGAPPGYPLTCAVPAARIGIDLDPIDLGDEDQVLWLRSFFAGSTASLTAAIPLVQAAGPRMIRGDALQHLEPLIRALPDSVVPCVFHSYCLYQFSDPAYARFRQLMVALGRIRPLHWISLEGHSLELFSFRPGHDPRSDLLATTDLRGGVHRWFNWVYAGRT